MEISDLKMSHNKVKFLLKNADISIANALRRTIIAEVPTLAIEFVTIDENTSALHDEFLAHRLGLVPIHFLTDERDEERRSITRAFNMHHECDCPTGACPKCSVILKLNVVNRESTPRIVTSLDLTIVDGRKDVEVAHFSCPEEAELVRERDNGVLIVKLGPGQSIQATCIATLGVGKMHAKWCPVGTAVFQYEHEIRLNPVALEKMSPDQKREFVAKAQPGLFTFDPTTGVVSIQDNASRRLVNMDELISVGTDTKTGESVVSVTPMPGRFWFKVETNGPMRADHIVLCALEVLQEKLERLHKAVLHSAGADLSDPVGGGAGGPDGLGLRYQ